MVTAIVIIVLLALLLLGLFAFQKARRNAELQQRRSELKDRFGPEYERYLAGSDNRTKAERRLAAIADRRDKLQIRDLSTEEKARFGARWSAAQARFVDEPPAAVDDAETLINTVMKERGYPVEDFATRSDMVMVDHAEIVQEYRSAHESHERHRNSGQLETEDLRQAFMHYRKLFHALVGTPEPVSTTRPPAAGKHADAPVGDAAVSDDPAGDGSVRDGDTPVRDTVPLPARDADRRPPVSPTRHEGTGESTTVNADHENTNRHPQETR
ncbi:hypothetical protein GCM10022223_57370 [Kineosporia mesophila]|uniref:Secreted protein n=1 Tax=Kineosporia mesophila TaxID=566012 RepID=A0ABP7AGY4_9ACTN|nr:hypothetical protein [Kineosporia mesophila]MCD5350895.1 hypothetical protein [Kineosporia mesophila]